VTAQADFRANDRDGNEIQDYWRKDVAGLYTVRDQKLIELSLAAADARPTEPIERFASRSPKAGYLYRALLHEGESVPGPDRFAFAAFPESPAAGPLTFIIDERGVVWKKARPGAVLFFPADPVRAGWTRMEY